MDMTPEQVDRILGEYDFTQDLSVDSELEAVRAAVFIEDVFNIRLTDAEIDPALLGSAETMRTLVLRKLGAD
jgi:hypothetical protein